VGQIGLNFKGDGKRCHQEGGKKANSWDVKNVRCMTVLTALEGKTSSFDTLRKPGWCHLCQPSPRMTLPCLLLLLPAFWTLPFCSPTVPMICCILSSLSLKLCHLLGHPFSARASHSRQGGLCVCYPCHNPYMELGDSLCVTPAIHS
jgi:hypothetical protein